jgi:DNA invertase Pin-like site-specific DNA recombinase
VQRIAYSYTRFSTPRQEEGDSERRQIEAARQYAAENGFILDQSIGVDRGKSAWTGANIADGALGAFIRRIGAHQISKGSILIVESPDRISRQTFSEAYPTYQRILNAGIEIHFPSIREVLKPHHSFTDFLRIGIEIDRGNSESARKSERCGAAWSRKRKEANGKAAMSARVPLWLKAEKGKPIEKIPERAAIIRKMFEWAAKGLGQFVICDKLIDANVPPWGPTYKGRAPRWTPAYVSSILSSRAVIGEYQPYISPKGKPRVKDGATIPNYYPPIIPISLFQTVQEVRRTFANAKFGESLRRGKDLHSDKNLFRRLVWDANNGAPMVFRNFEGGYSCLVTTHRKNLRQHKVDYRTFERIMLEFLSAADWKAIAREGEKGVPTELLARQEVLAGLIDDNSKVLGRYRAMIADPDFAGFDSIQSDYKLALLESRRLVEERTVLKAQIDACCRANETISQTKGVDMYAVGRGSKEDRLKLRLYLAQRIERIDIDFRAEYKGNLAIFHFGGKGTFVDLTPEQLPEGKGMVAKVTFTNHAERLVIFTPDGGHLLWLK